ncbi:MAG TPA: hypothetical protein VHB21_23950 [Minicystis sp.]|nr:hypothetical protein [Minicystis sp.]
MTKPFRAAIALAVLGFASAGCAAGIATDPVYFESDVPVARADAVPNDVYAYPRVWYAGRYVYLVHGRWVYATSAGWYYFRREPSFLASQRARIYDARFFASAQHGAVAHADVEARTH